MSKFLRYFPATVSFLILAAHFLREGNTIVAVILALLPILLGVKNKKATYYLQGVLVLGAVEWCLTAYNILTLRLAMADDWVRMFAILTCVVLFTLFSAYQLFKNDEK